MQSHLLIPSKSSFLLHRRLGLEFEQAIAVVAAIEEEEEGMAEEDRARRLSDRRCREIRDHRHVEDVRSGLPD